ncbi:enoyl-CoA hydratase-related protein [Nocardioides sp. YIM 152315]|uniref:enoyl-CoA hydratase/isomerase family protein n=1 Tax=Nocardioides sp. YIM 152315 TaxID=3031760 RepID=UPI0023DAB60A|nr:enoyl-CoA hydratase-related protein [Nocardioides sp. YIM 152315]MDF1604704.1 enoyl-CoA hydratase-related protein [Nocardioides sp. YIM 152315]
MHNNGTTSVRCEIHADGVAVVTLEGAAKLNAFSRGTAVELGEALRRCDADDDVRVVVLTGAGRAFCAGADLSEPAVFAGGDDFDASPIDPAPSRLRTLVIAAVNGPAIGIGMSLAMQCDLRYVAEDAPLAISQVRRGMVGDVASHATVRRAVGMTHAAELLLTGRTLTGADAARSGLANRAVPADQVLPTALEVARDVAAGCSPASIALSKAILWGDADLSSVGRAETRAHRLLMDHPDAREASAAWREGRPPRWTMRASDLPADLSVALFGEDER